MNPVPTIVPISDLRARQNELLGKLSEGPIIFTQHGRPVAVMVDPRRWNQLLEEYEDLYDSVAALEAKIELLTGQDDTITLEEFEAELSVVPA